MFYNFVSSKLFRENLLMPLLTGTIKDENRDAGGDRTRDILVLSARREN
jgi:hypothetical protein